MIFRTTLSLALLLLVSLYAPRVLAQAAWETPLQTQLTAFAEDSSPASLDRVSTTIERIAAANPDAWLPNYHAAYFQQLRHYYAGEDGCKPCIEAMDAYLTKAEDADNNSEVLTLRASYYQAMLNLHPMRAPYYGPKAGSILEQAVKADPNNPRAASLLGQNFYYTPAMFGGGSDVAAPHLKRAVELFATEATTERGLLPSWGAERASKMSEKALAEL